MLKRLFNPLLAYRYVRYGRMSDEKQNPRSPDQQFQVIEDTRARNRHPWVHVADYRDDAISGRLVRRRPGLQRLLADIKKGRIKIDLIIVDTYERFGRAEEIDQIRKMLRKRFGILVLTADSNLVDPTSVAGTALTAVETIRATEDNRVKAHNVLRGKLDCVLQKQWPGGKPPFGFKIEHLPPVGSGRYKRTPAILVPDSATVWIIRWLFEKAKATGWGAGRLAKALNEHPEIPEDLKPFDQTSVGYWLDQTLYYGEMTFGEVCTDIVDDRRVIQRNQPDDLEIVPDYCEPLITKELWLEVQAVRRERSRRVLAARAKGKDDEKLLKPISPGVSLLYAFSGLVRCGHCGRAMVCAAARPYTAADGVTRNYASYGCPAYYAGACGNDQRIPEEWLRGNVIDKLMSRLSLTPDEERPKRNDPQVWTAEQLANCAWFQELMREYRDELERCLTLERSRHPDLRHEREQLDQKLRGWTQSLANPNLAPAVRGILEEDLNRALRRQQEIDAMLSADESREQCLEDLLDPKLVVERLNRLSEIVANGNPTRSNLELALHIDRIDGFQDGRVVLRTCKLGAFDGAVEQLTFGQESSATDSPKPSDQISTPRRRALLNVDDGLEIGSLDSTNHFATDPNRFTGLPDHWFFIDEFQIPVKQSWAETHALVVAQYRIDNKASIAEAAQHFKKARDTIKNAVRFAKSKGLDSSEARGDLPCKPCWAAIHAEEVAAFMRQPLVIQKDAAEHFGKSLPTIIKALKIARERQVGPANPEDANDAA